MPVEVLHLLREDDAPPRWHERDDVVLLASARTGKESAIPSGTEGTVLAIWGDGERVEIAFAEPEGALATVSSRLLRRSGSSVP